MASAGRFKGLIEILFSYTALIDGESALGSYF
jgi:hypothetical protein